MTKPVETAIPERRLIQEFLDDDDVYIRKYMTWNDLMPVVEKIETLHDEFHGHFGVYISSNSCTIQGSRFNPSEENPHYAYFNCITLDSKIESTYRMCIRFIEWYNKHLNP